MSLWALFLIGFFLSIVSCAKNSPEVTQPVQVEIYASPVVPVQPEPVQVVQVQPEPVPLQPVVQTQPELVPVVQTQPPVQVVQAQPSPVIQTQSESVQVVQVQPALVVPVQPEPPPPQPEPFINQFNITQEVFETTKADIQALVEDLNGIIRAGNYNVWLTYLGDDYRRKINSREFLNELIEKYPAFKGRINNARDYFMYVVIPARANDHVDDIEFLAENEEKAYTRDDKGQTLVLYFFKNRDGKWKIEN
jgi:hypothetical protein